jgi:hypothetical protein
LNNVVPKSGNESGNIEKRESDLPRVHRVFLIGTCHDYQLRGEFSKVTSNQRDGFIAMLRDLTKRNAICGIGEEMNKEGLKRHFCLAESFARQVADELGIEHRYCDPDSATRKRLGIPESEAGWPQRERYWLEQLQALNRFPALFIMGAEHFESFRDLLRQAGFEAIEVERDWVPSDFVPDEECNGDF